MVPLVYNPEFAVLYPLDFIQPPSDYSPSFPYPLFDFSGNDLTSLACDQIIVWCLRTNKPSTFRSAPPLSAKLLFRLVPPFWGLFSRRPPVSKTSHSVSARLLRAHFWPLVLGMVSSFCSVSFFFSLQPCDYVTLPLALLPNPPCLQYRLP